MRAGKGLYYMLAIIFLMMACDTSKHELEIKTTNAVNTEENAMINCILENLLNEVEYNILSINTGIETKQDSFPKVKVNYGNSLNTTQSIIVDYGINYQLDYLGHEKKGKINTTISGEYTKANCIQIIHFEEFYFNNLKISGSIDLETLPFSESNNLRFSITYHDIKFESESGQTYTVNGSKTKEWIEGFDTDNPWDDQFFISGTIFGVNSEKREYNAEILTPLLISRACEFITQGEINFSVENEQCIYNYGNGKCDNKGFFTSNEKTTNFEFGRYEFRYSK